MEILKIKSVKGASIYHNRPVMIMRVDLKERVHESSADLPGFTQQLMDWLPGLIEHHCSPGHHGGFLERLHRGTYMAHIIEHVALELSTLAGIEVTYGKSVYAGKPGQYDIITRFKNEAGMKACLKLAFKLVESVLAGQRFDLAPELNQIREIVADTQMGPSTQSIFDAAVSRGIHCVRVGENSLLRLGYGKNTRFVQAAVTDRTSHIAVELVQDKALTKQVLEAAAIPVADGRTLSTLGDLDEALAVLEYPLAMKPLDGHHGQGVSLNISNHEEAIQAFHLAKEYGREVLIEKMCFGRDYRVLVIGGKFVAAAERVPPHVVGDGQLTIEQLIFELNQDPRRAEGHGGVLTKIEVDEQLLQTLEKQKLLLDTVLPNGERALLRQNANLSGGGTAIDVTDQVHTDVRRLCERIARKVGLDICGVDIIQPNITEPPGKGLKVIEVNAGPGLRMHLAPDQGKARPVGQEIVDMLYPSPEASRIPILAVTGTNGKTSSVRMLAKVMADRGYTVGMTSSDGVYIGKDQIDHGDTSGPISAEKVLTDPAVDCAVLELARGGMLRGGLAYDWCDAALVTNVRPDHIGQDGIEDLDDLVRIKALAVERVREGGTVVLNADDEKSLSMRFRPEMQRLKRNLMLYSVVDEGERVKEHVASGGDAAWIQRGKIHIAWRGNTTVLGSPAEIPVTMDGTALFQVSNLLGVMSMAVAQGLSPEAVFNSLESFLPSFENVGRINLYRVREGYLILDYGHNPDAISAVGEMLDHYHGFKKTAVVGFPGDRADDLIADSAKRLCEFFDRIILRDDTDLRGRKPGEVPARVESVIRQQNRDIEISQPIDEAVAIAEALSNIQPDEIVVLFYDNLPVALRAIRQFDPAPVVKIPRSASNLRSGIPVVLEDDRNHWWAGK